MYEPSFLELVKLKDLFVWFFANLLYSNRWTEAQGCKGVYSRTQHPSGKAGKKWHADTTEGRPQKLAPKRTGLEPVTRGSSLPFSRLWDHRQEGRTVSYPLPSLTLAKNLQDAYCAVATRLLSFAVLNMRKNPKTPLQGKKYSCVTKAGLPLANSRSVYAPLS